MDPAVHDRPIYSLSEAASFLKMPASTVRYWVQGRSMAGEKSRPLIIVADRPRSRLSFSNLIELHVLASIRTVHGVTMPSVRKALTYLEKKMHVSRPLIDQTMLTDGRDLFIERLGEFVNVTEQGQLHIRGLLDSHLQRIQRDLDGRIIRFHPFTRVDHDQSPKFIALDPLIRSGRPCLTETRIATQIIASRFHAGDSTLFLAEDYGRRVEEIEEAVRYESRTAA